MEVLWNQMNLQRPPYRSWDISVKQFDSRKFIETVNKIIDDFKSFDTLHSEAALLSRLIYRMKSKFRSDKGLKYMEKVNRGLLNYLNMSLEREYELMKEYIETNGGIISLPPRQTLEYVLVRTQGFAKLMCRIEATAMMAANVLKSRLHLGQSWTVAMIAYAVISRIWILSRYIIKKICVWYDSIHIYLKFFKIVGIQWLPDNYILPNNLSQWLDLPWFNEDMQKLPMKGDWNKSIFNLIENNNESNLLDDDIKKTIVGEQIKEDENNQRKNTEENLKLNNDDDDLGETVSRIHFEEANKTKKLEKKKKKKKNNMIDEADERLKILQIECEKDLVRLLKTDSCPGFDKPQWKILQKRLKKLLIKVTKNNTCDLDDKSLKKVNKHIKKWTDS